MSVRLVRRLLRETSDLDASSRQEGDGQDTATGNQQPKRKQAKKAAAPLGSDEVFRHQVDSLLYLDGRMASKHSKKLGTVERMKQQNRKERNIEKSTAKKILGNSRGTSSALKTKSVPTFDKVKYKKQKEEKRLTRIANLLKKNSPKKSR